MLEKSCSDEQAKRINNQLLACEPTFSINLIRGKDPVGCSFVHAFLKIRRNGGTKGELQLVVSYYNKHCCEYRAIGGG